MATENERLIQPFGYTEMYEWVKVPAVKLGVFVQFSKRYPNKIELYNGGVLAGVSTICSVIESDDPNNWQLSYATDPVGDVYMREETLAVGVKEYDQNNELSYIATKPWKHFVKVPNPKFNSEVQYVKRTNRKEWTRVNLIGKTIVIDNGACTPGQFCTPYVGEDYEKCGTAVPATTEHNKFYVLSRISPTTIMILNNAVTNI